MRRLASLDVLRALAILLMVQVHFVENLSPRDGSAATLYDLSTALGSLSAPLFSFLLGLSLWLWLRRETGRGRGDLQAGKFVARRGLLLFGAGLAFAVIIWMPKEVFNWDILPLLGVSTLILFLLRKWPPHALLAPAILVLLISPPLRTITDYGSHWHGEEYVYRFAMKDVVLGFFLQGYFPLLPWVVFPLVGFATGRVFWGEKSEDRLTGWQLPIFGLGLVILAALGTILSEAMPRALRGFLSELTFYPASTTYVLGMLGVILLGLWGLHRALDSSPVSPKGPVLAFLGRYSRFALTTYVVHHALHVWPLLFLAAWEGKRDPWWYYGDAVSTPMALILALLFIAGFYGVLVMWDRKREYSFEGILRWLSEA
jgi:uncharacterized membrane protein